MKTSAEGTAADTGIDRDGNWPGLARNWAQLGSPLRPVPEDIDLCWDAVSGWISRHGSPRVILLGVTPELYRLPWPDGTDFLAVDHTQEMIDYVWPGPREAVLCAEWPDIHLPECSRDIALCDGGFHLQPYPKVQAGIARTLGRILVDGGIFVLRLYGPPAEREAPEAVLADLLEGRISNLHILKLRLGMAMTDDIRQGVELDAVWGAVHEVAPDLEALAKGLGWTVEHTRILNTYRGSKLRYHYVTADHVADMFCREPGGFEIQSIRPASYELGEQCPTMVFRRRRT